MNDCNVPEAVCQERLRIQEERFARDRERLEKCEERIEPVEKAVLLLTEIQKQAREELSDHSKRIETLEHRPNVWIDRIVGWGVSALIGGGIGLLFNIVG